ncbi:FecR family protein [Flavihumibacter sp. CACIAM 22H1]|uniref:FecR family protein n=1 Tax=Flavihumibacter sp. CACIAM 22H1 TaxID=1812911 RepID=UPI0007A82E54|nr:FecR family protein [Flavihumibacter sp. CACIAM 22H1]KYP16275.1 MAG: hypothetical protein A1D16_20260 [Flavihumibacter sp. CACIAM 22H1]
MKPKKGLNLLKKYLAAKADPEEQTRVDKWYDSLEESEAGLPIPDGLEEASYQRTWQRLNSTIPAIPFFKRTITRLSVAALLLVSFGTVWYLANPTRPKPAAPQVQLAEPSPDVAAPQETKAVLELADGTVIVLDSVGTGSLTTQGNARVSKLGTDKIAYTSLELETGQPSYNTLRVPKGSKPVQLQLADGSLVWLNVGSSLTYPSHFIGNTREVNMTGEAYFEIAKDPAKPFLVKKGDLRIQVLGTHFNVNAYDDEAASKITLLEGSVEVHPSLTEKLVIKPGQQAQVTANQDMKLVKSVDLEEVMAWKNGWFYFNAIGLPEIMRQLEKWYDVEVIYQGTKSSKKFTGMVDRNNPLSEVLKLMEMAGIKFRITGKKIHVMQ